MDKLNFIHMENKGRKWEKRTCVEDIYSCTHSTFISSQRFLFDLSEAASACASLSVSLSESLVLD